MKIKAIGFKTKTANGRTAKTVVFMPQANIVVINQRALVLKNDIAEGWFVDHKPIKTLNDILLVEKEIVLFSESFDKIVECVQQLNKLNKSKAF